jgi:hypothetical protein
MYQVACHEELKIEKTFELEDYVCIINAWKVDLQGKNDQMDDYRNLLSIENRIDDKLMVKLSKRSQSNRHWQENKIYKLGSCEKGLVALNEKVIEAYAEYKMNKYSFQKEMLNAIYYREITMAISNKEKMITSDFNRYF